ncbi:MAG TPA: hypothetical protein VEX15_12195 [Nocardioidaceae bacterium]|nr:hypothetical protein [Nocardioidaceae bacterium]
MMWVKIVGGEVYVNLSADAATTATIVDETASATLADFEVELTGDSLSQFVYANRNEVLIRARELISNFDEAGGRGPQLAGHAGVLGRRQSSARADARTGPVGCPRREKSDRSPDVDAYGERQLDLTITKGRVMPNGLVMPPESVN